MGVAIVDSNVLAGWQIAGDQYHDRAETIIEGIQTGTLPRARILLDRPTESDIENGRAIFRMRQGFEYPDALTVAYMRRQGLRYIYSFDTKFDRLNGITRLNSAVIRTAVTIFSGGATQQGLQRLSTLILLGGAVKTHSSPYQSVSVALAAGTGDAAVAGCATTPITCS